MWIDDYVAAWNDHDADAATEFMTNDIVYTDLALGEQFKGVAAVRVFFNSMETGLSSDYHFTRGQVIATSDAYAFEWTLSGTNDRADDERGSPATGERFEVPGVSIGTLRDGKIKENRDYWNMTTYLTQVGLMPKP